MNSDKKLKPLIDENYLIIESLKHENKLLLSQLNQQNIKYHELIDNIKVIVDSLHQSVNSMLLNYQSIKYKFNNKIELTSDDYMISEDKSINICNQIRFITRKINSIDLLLVNNVSYDKACQIENTIELINKSIQTDKSNLSYCYHKLYKRNPDLKLRSNRLSLIERNSKDFISNHRLDFASLDSNCLSIPVIIPGDQNKKTNKVIDYDYDDDYTISPEVILEDNNKDNNMIMIDKTSLDINDNKIHSIKQNEKSIKKITKTKTRLKSKKL